MEERGRDGREEDRFEEEEEMTNQISQLEVGNFHNHLCPWRCSSYKAKRAYVTNH